MAKRVTAPKVLDKRSRGRRSASAVTGSEVKRGNSTFDVAAWRALSAEEKGRQIAALFVANLNAAAVSGE